MHFKHSFHLFSEKGTFFFKLLYANIIESEVISITFLES